jgi:hypothetical protein
MARSIFTAPIEEITFADVVAFCEQATPESVNLDYKLQLPEGEKLAKTVTAFANTFGGVVLVGVDEDEKSCPKTPFDGLIYASKLEEQVWSMLMANIYPPVLPEIHVCVPEDGKTFIVIRVAQSVIAPHAIRHNTNVYLRTGNITQPTLVERLATINEVEWLIDRRRRSEELRESIVARMHSHARTLERLRQMTATKPRIDVWLGPKFPVAALLGRADLEELRRSTRLYVDQFSEEIRVHDGVARTYFTSDALETYAETNIFGFIFESGGLGSLTDNQPNVVFLASAVDAIADVIRFATKFLPKLGYWGACEIGITLHNLEGKTLRPLGDRWVTQQKVQLEDTLEFRREVTTVTDEAALEVLIADVVTAIAWSFGWNVDAPATAHHLSRSDSWRRSG